MAATVATYTIEEVAQHKKSTDHWTVINGKVYDLTNFVDRHPGGSLIISTAGIDATEVYETYHFTHKQRADAVIAKFCIGDFAGKSPKMGEFWHECGRRVVKVLATLPNKGRFPWRAKWVYALDSVCYLGMMFFSQFLTTETVATHPLFFIVASVLYFGVFCGRFQQQNHALGHFMLFKSDALTVVLDHFMIAAACISSTTFSFTSKGNPREKVHLPRAQCTREFGKVRGPCEHQIIHHVRGATLESDRCREAVARDGYFRLATWDNYKPFHRFQTSTFYQMLITSLFVNLRNGPGAMLTRLSLCKVFVYGREWSRAVSCLIGVYPGFLWLRFWTLPLMAGTLQGLGVYLSVLSIITYFGLDNNYGLLFYAQHRWDLTHDENEVSEDWGKYNCETSASLHPRHSWHPYMWFMDRTCPATLSFHLEHTLFPGISYYHLKDIAPVVEQCAKEYGMEYFKFDGVKELHDWQQGLLRDHATPKKKM